MSNSLNSTGLTVGDLGGCLKQIIDPSRTGLLILDPATITLSANYPTDPPSSSQTYTLPSISVGSTGIKAYMIMGRNLTLKVNLPSSGNYVYKAITGGSSSGAASLTLNYNTDPRASGGTQVASKTSGSTLSTMTISAAVIYYRYA